MIFLDANAFYWYLGREKIFSQVSVPKHDVSKCNQFLDTRSDLSIPGSVLMEMIVHFRDNPNALTHIIRFLEKKRIKVLNNVHEYCFTPDELDYLQLTSNATTLKQYANKLLKIKIDIEVKHAYVFLEIVSLLYADYYLKSCRSLSADERDSLIYFLGDNLSDCLRKDFTEQLTSALETGYADNNRSQQALKKKYIDLLVQNCMIFQMIIDTSIKYLDGGINLYEAMCQSAADARNNGFTNDGIMGVIVAALSTDSAFLSYAKNEISDIFLRKGYSKHQADYLKLMLSAWLERGQKLIKNDIFDMLCVGVLDKRDIDHRLNLLIDQSPYLISFDDTMRNYLCGDVGNARLIGRFMLP